MEGGHFGGECDCYWGLEEARASSAPWALRGHPAGDLSQQVQGEGCLNEGVAAVSQAWSPGGPGSGSPLSGRPTRRL